MESSDEVFGVFLFGLWRVECQGEKNRAAQDVEVQGKRDENVIMEEWYLEINLTFEKEAPYKNGGKKRNMRETKDRPVNKGICKWTP